MPNMTEATPCTAFHLGSHALRFVAMVLDICDACAGAVEAWRSQLRAELAHGGGLERLTEAERLRITEGRSFERIFNGERTNVQLLPWNLRDAKCEVAYIEGDANPWCRCTTTIPAAMEAVRPTATPARLTRRD